MPDFNSPFLPPIPGTAAGTPPVASAPGVLPPPGLGGGLQGMQQGKGQFWDAIHGARGQFGQDLNQWRQDGRVGDRPMFRNYLMPNGGQSLPVPLGLPQGGQAPQPPVPPQAPGAPYQGVGTGLSVQGMQMPTNPYAIPGYGG